VFDTYYDVCGKIDQHNRLEFGRMTWGIERKFRRTLDWGTFLWGERAVVLLVGKLALWADFAILLPVNCRNRSIFLANSTYPCKCPSKSSTDSIVLNHYVWSVVDLHE